MKKLKILWIPLLIITALAVLLISGCGKEAEPEEIPAGEEVEAEEIPADEEVEATEYLGTKLTPIEEQLNNALSGTKILDRDTYTLTIDGLVDNTLTLTYDELLEYPQESWLMDLNCVEGWSFTAKWTGPRLNAIFEDAGMQPEAKIAIFYTVDVPDEGYTSLRLDYIRDNNILLAFKLNDITLPNDRGFPFQVVAKEKFGYKWAKWVTRIELSSNEDYKGFWEKAGYNNDAYDKGPPFEQNSE